MIRVKIRHFAAGAAARAHAIAYLFDAATARAAREL